MRPVEGPMGWRGLLRVVDFQRLLSPPPAGADALDKAQRAGGTKSPEVRSLREAYYLLAKVLWTRRASIQRVHDLAWLDHTVVSAGARVGRVWEGAEGLRSVTEVAERGGPAIFRELLPGDGSDWLEVPVAADSGISPIVKPEKGL